MHKHIVQHINLLRRKNISKFSLWGLTPHCSLGVLAFSTNAERKQSTDCYSWTGYWMPCRVICAWCLTRGPYGPASVQYHFIGTAARCHSSEEGHWWQWSSWSWWLGILTSAFTQKTFHGSLPYCYSSPLNGLVKSTFPPSVPPLSTSSSPCLTVQHTTCFPSPRPLCITAPSPHNLKELQKKPPDLTSTQQTLGIPSFPRNPHGNNCTL